MLEWYNVNLQLMFLVVLVNLMARATPPSSSASALLPDALHHSMCPPDPRLRGLHSLPPLLVSSCSFSTLSFKCEKAVAVSGYWLKPLTAAA
jgi:hypothetical protein